jgi:hypothetical protein
MNPDSVSRAIVVWTGWGVRTWPQRQDAAVLEVFGPSEGPSILVRVKELASEFYESEARSTVADLDEMGRVAAATFRASHPELDEEAIRAFSWCYTFDYR